MLTGDLVRVRLRRGVVEPCLVDPADPDLLERAAAMLEVLERAEAGGWTRGRVEAAFRELEAGDADPRLGRGIAKVLLDRCAFETQAELDPAELRERAFRAAAARGPLARRPGTPGRSTAADVLEGLAAELARQRAPRLDAAALGRALYADLPEEQVLVGRDGPRTPEAVLHRYNLALVQALLLRATRLVVELPAATPARLRQLLRWLRFRQLMFRLLDAERGVRLHVDGPQSLLRLSTRYGRNLALFFPAVLLQPAPWRAEAEVFWGRRRRMRRLLVLTHETGLVGTLPDTGAWRPRVETHFEERFRAAGTGWAISPGEPIPLGGQRLLLPCFTFRKDGRVAHLDILGTWRRRWLEERLAEAPPHVVLAVSRRLRVDRAAPPRAAAARVVEFAEVVPVREVVERLEAVAVAEDAGAPGVLPRT